MSEVDGYVSLISQIAFPIVAYLLLFLKLDNSIKELTKAVQELCSKVVSD